MVDTIFWEDNYSAELDPIEKLLFLYFLTNSSTSICGVYQITLKKIAVETGIEKEMVSKILLRFSTDNKIFYIDGWVIISNFIKHQNQGSPKILKGILNELSNLPEKIRTFILSHSKGMDTLSHLIQFNLIKSNSIKCNVKAFAIPSLSEISSYCLEIKSNVNPEDFFNHYESNGWMIGENKMEDWQAAFRKWDSREKETGKNDKNKTLIIK